MSSPNPADEAVITRTRDAMTALRAAEHTLLTTIGELAESGAWETTGHRGLGRFLEELWRVDPAHAKRLVAHAEQVLPTVTLTGQPVPPRMPHTARASSDGAIGEEHLRVLVRALSRVERIPDLDPTQAAAAEELLAGAARTLSPSGLERVITELLDRLDPDGAAPEEDPEPTDELLMTRRRDGTLAFTGRVHGGADVELLLETFDALSRPAGPEDPRSLPQRRSEALLDLCDQSRTTHGIADPDQPEPTVRRPRRPAHRRRPARPPRRGLRQRLAPWTPPPRPRHRRRRAGAGRPLRAAAHRRATRRGTGRRRTGRRPIGRRPR